LEARGAPVVIIADTVKGNGITAFQGTVDSHYLPLSDEQYRQAIDELTHALPRRSLSAGEVLFLEGAHGDELYLLLEGMIQIYSTGELDDVLTFP
jgi:CRP-like cAMP-binding protein